jgi:uncharacterized protein (DUF736 family)
LDASNYDKASDTFSGAIFTLHFQIGDVQFVPADKKSDNGPQYRLVAGHIAAG